MRSALCIGLSRFALVVGIGVLTLSGARADEAEDLAEAAVKQLRGTVVRNGQLPGKTGRLRRLGSHGPRPRPQSLLLTAWKTAVPSRQPGPLLAMNVVK